MKTFVLHLKKISYSLAVTFTLLLCISVTGQSYTTVSNGAWSSASTWQGGNIPAATNIPVSVSINIKHIITYTGGNILNNGTITINNPGGVTPRLIIASGINITNTLSGKLIVKNAELRQYRFSGGGESGTPQTGNFTNNGGYVEVQNGFMEIAQDFENQTGVVVFSNSSIVLGANYKLKSGGIDSLDRSSMSVGMHGTGEYDANGLSSFFKSARIQVASSNGRFRINGGIANGSIDYIMMKNHVTGTYSNDKIEVAGSVVNAGGLSLKAYCIGNLSNYQCNGKFSGTQTPDCSLPYFPSGLNWASTEISLNLSSDPVLIAGTDRQVGAQYRYEGVAPGIDIIFKIDSLKGGATIYKIDDNSLGFGFKEGFQPRIKSGSIVGLSYAVFTFSYRITGTSTNHTLNTFSLTGLDIDGDWDLKEFDEIGMGAGATASYIGSNPSILFSEEQPGTFRGINIDGQSMGGIDTSAKQYMFSVTNANVSSFTLKMGMQTTNPSSETRMYSIYMKGFMYPELSTLPVKMESFTAVLDKGKEKVNLQWKTASEINVSHFVVEKSVNGVDYKEIGIVFANGNSSDLKQYQFEDNVSNDHDAILYYRLRTVDNDEKYMYSQVRLIGLTGKQNTVSITSYPNPVTSELRITIPNNWQNKKVVYELFQANGQEVKRTENANSGQTETLDVSNLMTGFYVVRATCNGETAQQKIIKR